MHPEEWGQNSSWNQPPDPRPRYRISRVAFALSALGVFMVAVDMACFLGVIFRVHPGLFQIRHSAAWDWLVGTPMTWGTFLGSLLFLGRFRTASWKARAIPLFLMNAFDMVHWCMEHAEILGLHSGPPLIKADLMTGIFNPIMNLAEVLLFAGMAKEVCVHLDGQDAQASHAAARSAVWIGIALHVFVMVNIIDPGGGWPLRIRPIRDPKLAQMLEHAGISSLVATTVAAVFTAYLLLQACRLCSEVVRNLDQQDRERDSFHP